MTDLPVIAVPTPVGYGFGGEGIGTLTTMLQTCAPGLLVVNIGNTIGGIDNRFFRHSKKRD
ncbi:hypothetical protein [Thermotoga sp.]|uniref:hypothetical protein n=1 Tax=Thermotoga sp. TaxID=28240 RepID=UPI0025E39A5A|nr:hypothetical protein [Thermotoga sp.]